MIEIATGNLLTTDAEALVNTVNCDGFMGKGIALQFKQAFPANFSQYARACRVGEVLPGRMFVHENAGLINPRFIINFPTKRHWRERSRIEDIRSGLAALIVEVRRLGIASIAVPPLGCGLGGLDWGQVRPMIEAAFAELPGVRVLLFPPTGAPAAKSMPVGTARPGMTQARALFIGLMDAYAALDYSRTLLEVQKLAYFLQEAGEPLRLRFEAAHYGPYAANLNKVLEVMEGHYIRGYGDSQTPQAEIDLLPGAVDQAAAFLADRLESRARMERVVGLIEGFETPYGMELLATVHWLSHRPGPGGAGPFDTPDEVGQAVRDWSPRKARLFRPGHVLAAWRRLGDAGWLDSSGTDSGR